MNVEPSRYHIGKLKKRNKDKLTIAETDAIRHYLHIPDGVPFARCGAKISMPGHEAKDHICEECRCKSIAGFRTSGWYYWPEDNKEGLGDVGHFGVGPCKFHEPKLKKAIMKQDRDIEMEIVAVQQRGVAPRDGSRFMIDIARSAEDLTLRRDVREARRTVRAALDKYQKAILGGDSLTEKGGPTGAMQITDKSRIELQLSIAKALSDISKNEFMASQNDYIHRDELKSFIQNILRISEQYIKQKNDWDEFTSQFKQAMFDVKTGKEKLEQDEQ